MNLWPFKWKKRRLHQFFTDRVGNNLSPQQREKSFCFVVLHHTGIYRLEERLGVMVPHWPTQVWWYHIGQHRCGGATLANTGVVVPHWPTQVWWCHIGQHRCGGATLANIGVVVPHWPAQVRWWCHIGQHR